MGVNALNYLFSKNIAPLLYPFLIGIAKVSRNSRLDGGMVVLYQSRIYQWNANGFYPFHIAYAFIKL
jgi:hypothetical protein